tara:strand:+ start:272 stop:1207 length:936 start_codon:yes stop_codon:yes gene_type:complete
MKFSIVIPVYNRPDQIKELLQSIIDQTFRDLEIIIVEDGSVISSEEIVNNYSKIINLKYLKTKNQGPGIARNNGSKLAQGEWLIFLDSDCTIPVNYFHEINLFLDKNKNIDFFGGPDRSDRSYSFLQKSINYSMTSLLTTGGIRGSKFSVDKFLPRSFNMGVKKEFFNKVNGFASLRFGEDLDLSYRLISIGANSGLILNAFVYHKRRTSLSSFYKQIYSSGSARVLLNKNHPGTFKIFHLFPIIFILVSVLSLYFYFLQIPLLLYLMLIFLNSSYTNKDPISGLLSVLTTCVQFFAYGIGFLKSFFKTYL